MAQPPSYERQKNFADDFGNETDHSALNAELDRASNSINDIRANLAILQADDGKLRPFVVTADSLSSELTEYVIDRATSGAAGYAQIATASAESAHTSQEAAQAAKEAAQHSARDALSSEEAAKTSEALAAASRTAAALSETNAALSQQEAAISAQSALDSAEAAASSCESALALYGDLETVKAAVSSATESADAAAESAASAGRSAGEAKSSETAAARSAASAGASEEAAALSEAEALSCKNIAVESQVRAAVSETNAAASARAAAASAEQAAAGQVNADWMAERGKALILNKPVLSAVAVSGSYNDLADKPVQVNADWNAEEGPGQILNRPDLAAVATSGSYSDISDTPPLSAVALSGHYNDLEGRPDIIASACPVGFIYVQFPDQLAPADLFGGEWSNISSQYAGHFFRAEGGNAAAFGSSQSGGAPNITGAFGPLLSIPNGAWANGAFNTAEVAYTFRDGGGVTFHHSNFDFTASRSNGAYSINEFRPSNITVRIWKRTA